MMVTSRTYIKVAKKKKPLKMSFQKSLQKSPKTSLLKSLKKSLKVANRGKVSVFLHVTSELPNEGWLFRKKKKSWSLVNRAI